MSDPYLGELRAFAFAYPPRGWALANGQQLPINQNQALFSLLGTQYGGNGQTTFALPDLRGRVAMHHGRNVIQGQVGGEEAHTLTVAELPTHTHAVQATSGTGDTPSPAGAVFAGIAANLYAPPGPLQPLATDSLTSAGGSQPHENMAPFLTLSVCIALQGIFPSRN